jgi:hypothetical protein
MSETVVLVSYHALPDRAETARRELEDLIATVQATEPDCGGITLLQGSNDAARSRRERRSQRSSWAAHGSLTSGRSSSERVRSGRAPGHLVLARVNEVCPQARRAGPAPAARVSWL